MCRNQGQRQRVSVSMMIVTSQLGQSAIARRNDADGEWEVPVSLRHLGAALFTNMDGSLEFAFKEMLLP